MAPHLKSFCERQQNFILDILKQKIKRIKRDLETYKEYVTHCQVSVSREMKLHTKANVNIKNLETELRESQHKINEAHAIICSTEHKCRALERQLQLQTEKVDLFEKELIKFNIQIKDADSNAQRCMKQVNQLSESLLQGDKQLEESRLKNSQLEEELKAAAQNLRYVESAFERSTQKLLSADSKILLLQQRLKETEQRAYQAELHIKQLQNDFINVEQNLEKRRFTFLTT